MGPGESNLMAMPHNTSTGKISISSAALVVRSSNRFILRYVFRLSHGPLARSYQAFSGRIRSQYSSRNAGLYYMGLMPPVISPDGAWVAYSGAYYNRNTEYSALITSPTNAGVNPPETIVTTQPPGDHYAARWPLGWRR